MAILLGHYNPTSCQHEFGIRLRALMERFQHIVRFGVYGHKHYEFYQISFSMTNPTKPVFLNTVGGSITPFSNSTGKNPSFHIIDIDAETLLPLEISTHYLDIEKANAEGKPTWKLSHNYTGTFEMKDLSPSSMVGFANHMKNDMELSSKWEWCMNGKAHSDTPPEKPTAPLVNYCHLVSAEMHENNECNKTDGKSNSAYGMSYDLFNLNGFMDRAIKSWTSVNK